jgi:hypothetical protein
MVVLLALSVFVEADPQEMEPGLKAANEMFYNGRYAEAAKATADLCTSQVSALQACELRASALHFQLRRLLGAATDKKLALAGCVGCADLVATFVAETRRAADTARAQLQKTPGDQETLFFLGKLDLNYVWLQLGTLGRKTGWDEYWEARHSLDKVLKANPRHVRAKVARAWIDYIVDTKLPLGTRWVMGGGSKRRGLQAIREAARSEGTTFERAEAGFALWDMQVREKDFTGARLTATMLSGDFPDNSDLRAFLDAHVAIASH